MEQEQKKKNYITALVLAGVAIGIFVIMIIRNLN